ncbi:MAG TPA: tRNA glutamyl-Q(34) synthetase GluQRS [Solirubrobacterales bacterium]
MNADGRFAPSPTGELHLGNLRTALLAWLFARSQGARFLVRVEDLDEGRVRERYVTQQLEDLRAIGLDWDEPPVRQSERKQLYAEALERLERDGLTYPCFCSRREIREAASAQHGEDAELVYPGTCARLAPSEARRRVEAGEQHALRLRAEGAVVTASDRLHGEVTRTVDDIVLVRRDGAFAYNLAVVVDDAAQGIGEIVRGDDLLSSTPRQALLYDLLGYERPTWAHVPLVIGPDGQRLAKRHGAVTLRDLAAKGLSPAQVAARLARSLGLAEPGEEPTPVELLARFDPASLPREAWVLPDEWRATRC